LTAPRWRVTVAAVTEAFEPEPDGPLRVGVALTATATATASTAPPATVVQTRLGSFCQALSAAIGVETVPYNANDYPSLLEAMHSGRVDVAWLPPVVALRAASTGRALPIALPVRRGVSSFYSALFARPDSAMRRAADLSGARAAWVNAQSASGYLVIRAALRAQGLDLDRAFSEQTFAGSHVAVVRAVLDGKADVGATFMHHDPSGTTPARAGWGSADVHVIARVGPIPADVIAAGVHVPVARIRAVQRALVGGEHAALTAAGALLLEAEGFVVAEGAHLEPLEKLLGFLEDTAYRWGSVFPPPSTRFG
jgi:phosphate/phosphite/phosphonate ABC transporter binding protein